MHKEKIRHAFNQAADSYDMFSQPQQEIGLHLISILEKYRCEAKNIIDFGCGTGLVTKELAKKIAYQTFQAVDFSPDLYEKAIKRLKPLQIACLNQDFDECDIQPDSVDIIFSNMALHWSHDFSYTLKRIHSFLNSEGLLVFTIPLESTFHELSNSKNNFYSIDQALQLLSDNSFNVLRSLNQDLVIGFSSWLDAMRSIKLTGSHYQYNKTNKYLKKSISFVGDPKLTYSIGYFIARKESHAC